MSGSIPLHPKHGLNPTMCTCFYCGKETGEIALLGNHYKDKAPMHMCVSVVPCTECKEKIKQDNITFIVEVEEHRNNAWGTESEIEPTGRYIAVQRIDDNDVMFATGKDFKQILKQNSMEEQNENKN